MLIAHGSTHVGMVRSINQDTMEIIKLNENCLFAVVCDGMGGVKGGDIASRAAVKLISERIRNGRYYKSGKVNKTVKAGKKPNENTIRSLLLTALDAANARIHHIANDDKSLDGMGTTAVAVFIEPPVMHIVNVGDSRAYIIGDAITQLTTDHSVVQEMVDAGKITKQEARVHPLKHIVTRVLGPYGNVEPDYFNVEIHDGDIIILCSDGLTELLEDTEIAFEAGMSENFETVPERLINIANERGGHDNITVIVIKYQKDGGPED